MDLSGPGQLDAALPADLPKRVRPNKCLQMRDPTGPADHDNRSCRQYRRRAGRGRRGWRHRHCQRALPRIGWVRSLRRCQRHCRSSRGGRCRRSRVRGRRHHVHRSGWPTTAYNRDQQDKIGRPRCSPLPMPLPTCAQGPSWAARPAFRNAVSAESESFSASRHRARPGFPGHRDATGWR
jgi:hypothetical protein